MTQLREDVVGLDAAILMHPRTWEASGHVAGFHDFFIDNKDSQKRYRVDHLLEVHVEQLEKEGDTEAKRLLTQMHGLMEKNDGEGLAHLLADHKGDMSSI